MERALYLIVCLLIFSCNSNHNKQEDDRIRTWILKNQQQLIFDSNNLIQKDSNSSDTSTNWGSKTYGITQYAENSLGELARIAGDSTECFDVYLTFYKDPNVKRKIMLGVSDSTCLEAFENLHLQTDSTNIFIFGKED